MTVGLIASRVMFPALSRIQGDAARVKRAYLRALSLTCLIAFPAIALLLAVAHPFMVTVYGPQWSGAARLLQILCIPAFVQVAVTTVGWIYQSQGRADWMFRWSLVSTAAVVGSFVLGLRWGAEGVAAAYAVCTILLAYPNIAIPGRLIGLTVSEFARAVGRIAGSAITAGAIAWGVSVLIPGSWNPAIPLTVGVLAGFASYVAMIRCFARSQLREFREVMSEYRHAAIRKAAALRSKRSAGVRGGVEIAP